MYVDVLYMRTVHVMQELLRRPAKCESRPITVNSYSPSLGLVAKLTNRLNSPNALGVSLPSPIPPSPLAARANNPGRPPDELVGENKAEDEGEVTILSPCGSISRPVRNDVSARSSFVEVTERKMSRRRC